MSDRCGGHIHIGADYLTMGESWKNLIEIWGNAENILYTISNQKGEIPRSDVFNYASPISRNFEEVLNRGEIDLQNEADFINFAKKVQNDRYYGINFRNIVDKEKNTIEFRLPNGTIDSDIWIQNINLFGGIVRCSEELAKIQIKPEEEKMPKEKKMIEYLNVINNPKTNNLEKLDALLSLVIPEKDRAIYRERYFKNSELIEQDPKIREGIKKSVTTRPITINSIGKKTFLKDGVEDGVTGQEYYQATQIIEESLQIQNR